MLILTKKDILFYTFVMCTLIVTIITSAYIVPEAKEVMSSSSYELPEKIIIDAGHGEPDGGAVSSDGVKESTLNLQIAKKVQTLLEDEGMEVIMTREDENNIADFDKQSSIREIKVSDINNRVEIANNSDAEFLISIHMNKFSDSKYRGWQTFYSKNSEVRQKVSRMHTRRN